MDYTVETKKPPTPGHKVGTVIGVLLCVLLASALLINLTLILRGITRPDRVPTVGNHFPLIVLTDSMSPHIQSGDLILCRAAQPEEVAVGDVISFFDPAGNGTSIVTHRVTEVTEAGWKTKGDANDAGDTSPVPAQNLAGIYQARIPGAGNVLLFLQTAPGLILCVICPIALLVGYDLLRRRRYEKDTEALLRELEALRAKTKEAQK